MNLYNNYKTDLPSKTNNISKESTTKFDHSQSLFNPELLSKRSVIINTSTSKAMYAFPRAPRFHSLSKDNSTFLYNLPDGKEGRAASFYYFERLTECSGGWRFPRWKRFL